MMETLCDLKIGLTDLANKNSDRPVEFEFQENKK